jgi:hypothetical protein
LRLVYVHSVHYNVLETGRQMEGGMSRSVILYKRLSFLHLPLLS